MIGDARPGGGSNNDDTSASMTATASQPPMKGPESPSTSSALPSQTAGSSLPGSPGSGGTSQSNTPSVVFFDLPKTKVFDLLDNSNPTILFSIANSTVRIDNLGWYVVDPDRLRQIGSSSETNTSLLSLGMFRFILPSCFFYINKLAAPFLSLILIPGPKEFKCANEQKFVRYIEPTKSVDKEASLNFDAFQTNNSNDFGQVMILAVNWTVNDISGFTSSPAFSVVRLFSDNSAAEAKLKSSPFSVSNEIIPGSGSVDSTVSSSSTDSHVGGIPTMIPTSTPTVSSGSGHSRGGLGTGAIAGIAVGVGVAALLAAAMGLFFFLRRRRRNSGGKAMDGASGEQEKLSSLMVVPKDANANASDPAIAPYRDEQHPQTATTGLAAAAAGGAAAETRELDEDDDEAAPLDQSDRRRAVPASRTGAAATEPHQGVSRHLVEDGMTEAEIRRLEEEERQLDDEIQRAGGRN